MLAPSPPLLHFAPALNLTPADLLVAAGLSAIGAPDALALAAALLAQATRHGHTCLRETDLTARLKAIDPTFAQTLAPMGWPWIGDEHSPPAPLARSLGRLYLWRHFQQEVELAARLRALATAAAAVQPSWLTAHLPQFFPSLGPKPDYQALAAANVLQSGLTLIAGGPGTGKTTTLARALGLYTAYALAHGRRPRLLLAAPTGKAAARMAEALTRTRPHLPLLVQEILPTAASTVHRLLGMNTSGHPRRGPQTPLVADLIAVDESSLMDGELAWHLVRALPTGTRLVLLGDPHQLTSVEEGAVLASLTASPKPEAIGPDLAHFACTTYGWDVPAFSEPAPPLARCLVSLRHTYRFAPSSGIHALAAALRQGNQAALRQALGADWPDLHLEPWEGEAHLVDLLRRYALPGLRQLGRSSPEAALRDLDQVRLLAPLRQGPGGVLHLNALVEGMLRRGANPWFPGRLLLVQTNDPELGLANGDIGIVLPHNGGLWAWFPGPRGPRAIAPAALGHVESAYALTVHKAQGSEASTAIVVLPLEDHPIMTRELVYTAITRARQRLVLLGDPELLLMAATRPTHREAALAERLWTMG